MRPSYIASTSNATNGDGYAEYLASVADAPANSDTDGPRPHIVGVAELCADHPELRPPLIHGLLRRTEIANIIAPPKRAKSWLALQIAVAVATGQNLFGRHETEQGRVLLVDNELHPNTLAKRIPAVAGAMGVPLADLVERLDVESLRGRMADINAMASYFAGIEPEKYSLIVLDALYRFMPREFDENSNAQMTQIFNALDTYARLTGAAFLLVHHASKGAQGKKAITDVGSGAGAISRAADSHLILRDHEEEGVSVLESVVRSWAPPEPICIRWDWPIWRIAEGLDPTDLRHGGRRERELPTIPPEPERVWTPAEYAAEFVGPTPKAKKLILARATAASMTEREAARLLLLAVDSGAAFAHPAPAKNDRKSYYATVVPTVFSAAENDSLTHTRPPTPPVGRKTVHGAVESAREKGRKK